VQAEGAALTVAADPALAWTLADGEAAALPAPNDLALRFRAEVSGDGSPAGSLLLYGERPAGGAQRSFLQFSLASEGRWRVQFLDGASGSVTGLLEFRTDDELEVRLTGVAGPGAERLQVLAGGETVGEASLPSRLLAPGEGERSLRLGFQVSRGSQLVLRDAVLLGR
jgi:hypothetical protein